MSGGSDSCCWVWIEITAEQRSAIAMEDERAS